MNNISHEPGSGIRGEIILCQCRKVGKFELVPGSGKHRAKKGKLYDALCVIDRRLRTVPDRKLKSVKN